MHRIGVACPLGVEGHGSARGGRKIRNRCFVSIGRTAAIGRGVPARKVIASAGEGIGSQGLRLADVEGLVFHGAFAAIGIEDHLIAVDGQRSACIDRCGLSSRIINKIDAVHHFQDGVRAAGKAVIRCGSSIFPGLSAINAVFVTGFSLHRDGGSGYAHDFRVGAGAGGNRRAVAGGNIGGTQHAGRGLTRLL